MCDDIIKLLTLIKTVWSESNHQEAKKASFLLEDILAQDPVAEPWDDVDNLKCAAPVVPMYKGGGQHIDKLLQLTREANNNLPWKTPRHLVSTALRPGFSPSYDLAQLLGGEGKFKSAMMVGSKRYGATLESDKLLVGFTWLQEGTHYPMHAHHAAEVYQVLCGTASWGLTQHHLAPVAPGEYLYHPPATPHTIHVPADESLLAIYAWSGHTSGSFWFSDPDLATKYLPSLTKIQEQDHLGTNTQEYFDKFAEDYEAVMRAWGYNLPEIVASQLEELLGSLSGLVVVDVCCGSGLVAAALHARGVYNIMGIDLSVKMLDVARERAIYSRTIQADANHSLPLLDAGCDIVVCVGSTKFLQPSAMDEWLRIVKKGGLVAFTHIKHVVNEWEQHEKEKEDGSQWEKVWVTDNLPYLPGVKKSFWDYGKVHIYKKL